MIETKQFTKDVKISLLGLGTWQVGGLLEADHTNDKKEIAAIKAAIDTGLTHIDTAEVYANGHAEELVAEAIKDTARDSLFITSKVKARNCKYDDVLKSCKESLKRLQTDYLDLYLIHFPSPTIPFEETFKALHKLQEDGLIHHIGVSNFTVDQVKEAQKYTDKIICNQINYSLLARNGGKFTKNMETEIIPYCKEHNIKIVAFRPLEKGDLCKPGVYPELDSIAEKHNKTLAQVAINWLLCKDVFVLVKTTNAAHLKENIGSMGWRLDPEDVKELDDAFEKHAFPIDNSLTAQFYKE